MTKRTKRTKLTGKQQAFINAYFANGFVGWRAAQAAGYSGDEAALRSAASRMLTNANVQRAIDVRWKRAAMSADEVIGRLTEIARGDLDAVMDDTGAFDLRRARASGKTFLIRKQKIIEKFIPQDGDDDILIRTTELELYDAQAALGTLAKYHGLLSERLKVDDWRSEAVEGLRKGEITPQVAIDVFGDELARDLFKLAGVTHE
jgi:phage terminase small subunit